MKLDTLRGVIHEQGRLYRLWTNGKLKTDDMYKGINGLREIRSSIESIPPEAEVHAPSVINIIGVPSGHFVTEPGYRLERVIDQIEHNSVPQIEAVEATQEEPEPGTELTPRLAALENELNSLSYDELLARARQCGLVDVE